MFVRMDSIDWLLAYAADERYYQGIHDRRHLENPQSRINRTPFRWDFGAFAWVAEILSGAAKGATQRFRTERLLKSQWYHLLKDPGAAQWLDVKDTRWSNSSFTSRRAATKEIARLWCIATTQGERGEFEKSELFNPNATDRWIGQADMQGPRARSRSPRSACPERFLDRARGRLRTRGQTALGGFFEPAVAASVVKLEHTAVAETNVKAKPRESPTCKPAVAVPQPIVTVHSSDEE